MAAPPPSSGRTQPSHQGRILLVDDEDAVRRVVGTLLERMGYHVTGAASGRDALTALDGDPYDVMVCDLCMPELSGEELFAQMERQYPAMTGRVVFTSGDLGANEARALLARSGGHGIQKPYDIETLLAAIRSVQTSAPQQQSA